LATQHNLSLERLSALVTASTNSTIAPSHSSSPGGTRSTYHHLIITTNGLLSIHQSSLFFSVFKGHDQTFTAKEVPKLWRPLVGQNWGAQEKLTALLQQKKS
jgi:hypothetical protein